MEDYQAGYHAFTSRELTHDERIIERNLLKKRRDLIENGTKLTSIRIRNLKLYVDVKKATGRFMTTNILQFDDDQRSLK